jgi:hypothetical protein
MSRYEEKIRVGARRYLEHGEEVLAAFVGRPRGWTQSSAGGAGLAGMVAGELGARKQAGAQAAGEPAGVPIVEANAAADAKGLTAALERTRSGER